MMNFLLVEWKKMMMNFLLVQRKKGEGWPSINISERRCELKANEPVNERSE